MARPTCVVFAGVNGAGKSTFYRTGMWRSADMPQSMVRVNPDELLRDTGAAWDSSSAQLRAGKEALSLIDEALAARASLNLETTLVGRTAVKRLARAKNSGYRVVLFYIGVADVETALARIGHRVELGGHGIDSAVVKRRYDASLSGLCAAIPWCDEVWAFDNTVDFRCVAGWGRGVLRWWGDGAAGRWLAAAMVDEQIWRR